MVAEKSSATKSASAAGLATDPNKAPIADRELVLTRIINAPRALVFKAWIEPAQLAEWWGPKKFTNPLCNLDVRPGGAMLIHMRGPDGTIYPMSGEYREIVEPERLVFISSALDQHGQPMFEVLNTITFAEQDGKTKLTVHAQVSKATAAATKHLNGMEIGWTQSLERLERFTTSGAGQADTASEPTDRQIITTRLFDAPRELVFDAWLDREHIGQWWGPVGFTTTTSEIDTRPGGMWRCVMHGPDGTDYPNEVRYVEITRPQRLVYLHVSDPKFEMVATFEDQNGKTRLTMQMTFVSAIQRNRVAVEFGAVEGAKDTLERLGAYLARG